MNAHAAGLSRESRHTADMCLDGTYYVGTISRYGADPMRYPLSLNAQGPNVVLDNFDATCGNLWKWRGVTVTMPPASESSKIGGKANSAYGGSSAGGRAASKPEEETISGLALYCDNADHCGFLTPQMTISPNEEDAQPWQAVPYPRQRSRSSGDSLQAPGLTVQLRAAGTTRLLCADEHNRSVYVLAPADAKLKDQNTGKFIFNDAWELTPDEDLPPSLLANLIGTLAPNATAAN